LGGRPVKGKHYAAGEKSPSLSRGFLVGKTGGYRRGPPKGGEEKENSEEGMM